MRPMDDRLPIDDRIDAALRAGRERRPDGFAGRAVAAVARDRVRRRVLAFAQFSAAAAACLLLALPLVRSAGHDAEAERLAHAAVALEVGLPALDDADALAAFVVSGG